MCEIKTKGITDENRIKIKELFDEYDMMQKNICILTKIRKELIEKCGGYPTFDCITAAFGEVCRFKKNVINYNICYDAQHKGNIDFLIDLFFYLRELRFNECEIKRYSDKMDEILPKIANYFFE
jgi:hypothetical protein